MPPLQCFVPLCVEKLRKVAGLVCPVTVFFFPLLAVGGRSKCNAYGAAADDTFTGDTAALLADEKRTEHSGGSGLIGSGHKASL